ncbi:hypothetical protein [Burkholderia dolosa]|uniref:hypothetical protein n=1 Tax=Burkholderia dolosa TaxID=152500 RepID=UPI0010649C85|nr:hypothetical protein [Burkholderia dolosa]MBR8416230.1 hypothetical protein [Burkholderia dolosa]MBY4687944.1 hypothetical protein [Burkholderia dolosa]MCC5027814.1 hypothetical protein [Burkholderia dolosa]UEB51620.1 hypothetical protein LK423_08825 [Burkholderia dolosa]
MQAIACVTGVFVMWCVPSSTDRGLPQSSGNRAAIERQSSGNRAAIERQSSGNRAAIERQSSGNRAAIEPSQLTVESVPRWAAVRGGDTPPAPDIERIERRVECPAASGRSGSSSGFVE